MRIPVFARRSNPAISRPILRKSLAYGEEQVRCGVADWVDPLDHRKGIIAREMLASAKAPIKLIGDSPSLSSGEIVGCKFVRPPTAIPPNPAVRWLAAWYMNQIGKRVRMERAAQERHKRRLGQLAAS